MLLLLLAIAATLASILLRFIPLWRNKWIGVDSFYHLIVSEDIREGNHSTPGDDHFFFRSGYLHPPLLHQILSAFPKRHHRLLQYLGPIWNLSGGLFVWLASVEILGWQPSLLVLALYLTTPIIIDSSWTLGSRPLANLLFVALLSLRYLELGQPSLTAFVLTTALVMMIALTHRLYTQILILVSLADFVFIGSFSLVLPMLAGFCLLLLSRTYRRVLRGHISFVAAFSKMVSDRSLSEFVYLKMPNPADFLFNSPSVFALLVLAILLGFPSSQEVTVLSIALSVSILIFSIAWPFGQGYRHLAGLALPCAFYFVSLESGDTDLSFFIGMILAVQLSFQIIKTLRVLSPQLKYVVPENLLRSLGDLSKKAALNRGIILVLPLNYSYAVAYFSQFRVLEGSGGEAAGAVFNNILRRELKEEGLVQVLDRYDVSAVIFEFGLIREPYPSGFSLCCRHGDFACLFRDSD